MRNWAIIYLAGALAGLGIWAGLPGSVLALPAILMFFVFCVALAILAVTLLLRATRR